MVNNLRTLTDKPESAQKQVGNVSRDGNPKKESKVNATFSYKDNSL